MQSLMIRQLVFTVGMMVLGCAEAPLAYVLAGWTAVEGVGISLALCLLPGWLTIFSGDLMRHRDLSAYVIIVGMMFRGLFVVAGVLAVTTLRADLGLREFFVWLIVGYIVALALETWMVLLPAASSPVN